MSKSDAQQATEDALINEILSDARKKAERTVRRAEQESKDIIQKAQREAEEQLAAAVAAAQGRAERRKAIVLATVDVEAQRLELDARERLIQHAFAAAQGRIASRRGFDYHDTLVQLVADAIRAIGGDGFTITVPRADGESSSIAGLQQAVSQRLGRGVQLQIAGPPASISGGVIVHSADGRRMVDNSFEGRMARMHDDVRRRIARMLFEP